MRTSSTRPLLALLVFALPFALAQSMTSTLRLTITNTSNQTLSPPVLIAHDASYAPFVPGDAATPELARLAEDGDAGDLTSVARVAPGVVAVTVADAPLPPGESVTLEIPAGDAHYLTLVGMLVTTNDAFVAWTSSVAGLTMNATMTAPMDDAETSDGAMAPMVMTPSFADGVVRVFDAGSEANTERCEHVPGPPCGSPGARVPEGAEGAVALHGGILGLGDLDPAAWGWTHPVVTVAPAM